MVFALIVALILITGCTERQGSEIILNATAIPTLAAATSMPTTSPVVTTTIPLTQKSKAIASGYGIKLNESSTDIPYVVCFDFTFPNKGQPEYPAVTATFSGYDENGFRTSKVTEVYSLATDIYGGDSAYYNQFHKTAGCIYNNNFQPAFYYVLEVNGERL